MEAAAVAAGADVLEIEAGSYAFGSPNSDEMSVFWRGRYQKS